MMFAKRCGNEAKLELGNGPSVAFVDEEGAIAWRAARFAYTARDDRSRIAYSTISRILLVER